MQTTSPHTFHIPVMGLAYTIDTPVKVARFGINSVISIVEDNLIEKMREHYYKQQSEPYHPITHHETDYRARRITDYLNLVNRIVNSQVAKLRNEEFRPDSEITKYFEMLPQNSELRNIYSQMNKVSNEEDQLQLDNWLRREISQGALT